MNTPKPLCRKIPVWSWALLSLLGFGAPAQAAETTYTNPILPGFHADPSLCRVGDDYHIGLFAPGNGQRSNVPADFDWFEYQPLDQ